MSLVVAREPADTPTEQFAPRFTDPGLGAQLRAAQSADDGDAGLRLFEVVADREDDAGDRESGRGAPGDDPPGGAVARPRRAAVVACLVVLAAVLGVLTGYAVVWSTGGWNSTWVSAGEGTRPPSPDASLGPARQAQGVPSASPSPSASPTSPAPTRPEATPTAPSKSGDGTTAPPTGTEPEPTGESPSPSPSTTSPTRPEPTPSTSRPHEG